MKNPWEEIDFSKNPPYALTREIEIINSFNSKWKGTDCFIHLDLIPEPYIGNPKTCKCLLLSLNPGFSELDQEFHLRNKIFRELSISNLKHESLENPFYLLDPQIIESPGSAWWRRKLSEVIDEKGVIEIANNFAVIEYFPYHSTKYKTIKAALESQKYNFELVKACMRRDVIIVLMRNFNIWFKNIPKLRSHRNIYYCNNVQNPTISSGNLSRYHNKHEREKEQENSKLVFEHLTRIFD